VAPNPDQAITPARAYDDSPLTPRICAADLERPTVQGDKRPPYQHCRQ